MQLADFFKDKHGKVVVWQAPNLWLWGWIVSVAVGLLVKAQWVRFVGSLLLLVWAYLEVTSGASPFRRVLGGIVGSGILLQLFRN